MPVAVTDSSVPGLFPPLYRSTILSCQFSSWYPTFKRISVRGEAFKLGQEELDFRSWFEEDGVRMPEGVVEVDGDDEEEDEDQDDESDSSSTSSSLPPKTYSFPLLTANLRNQFECNPTGVFIKLNFTAPQDAQWILPLPAPLKCTTVEDCFMVLKGSSLVGHDLDEEMVWDGCVQEDHGEGSTKNEEDEKYQLEVIAKKWYEIERSREFRLFVRGNVLLGISQRDPNFYPHLQAPEKIEQIKNTCQDFWETRIRNKFAGGKEDSYAVDIYLSSNHTSAHIIDFNLFAPRTSPLLFEWEELLSIYTGQPSDPVSLLNTLSLTSPVRLPSSGLTPLDADGNELLNNPILLPILKVIPSREHPTAARNAPTWPVYPADVLEIASGKDIEEFAELWREEIARAATD